jgi:hypothetical protein
MKKYMVMCLLMIPSAIVIGMDSTSEKFQMKKMEIARRMFKKRNTAEMSTESSQADDEMSCSSSSSSGSFPIPIPKGIIQEKLSNSVRSKHGYTPRQRDFSKQLQDLVQQQEQQEQHDRQEKQNFLTFEILLMHFE